MKQSYHTSWPKRAIEAFERCITAHGGWSAWENFDYATFNIRAFTGLLPALKGYGKSFFTPVQFTVDPKSRVVIFDYGEHKDVFEDGKLTFSPAKLEIEDGRSIFKRSVFEKWQPQHALYFFGYAWANYIGYPFILPLFPLESFHAGEQRSFFTVKFPESFHTHCRSQTFHFNAENMLWRHDYRASIAGPIFYACHYTEGYETCNGIKVACIRRVRPGVSPLILPINGLYAELELQR